MEDYTPLNNKLIEDTLVSLDENPKEGHRRLDDLVRSELTPVKKQKQLNLFLTDKQKMICFALTFCLGKYEYDRRDIGNNLMSKHSVDTGRALIKYDIGNNINYLDVCAALLHDLIEDKKIHIMEIRDYFIYNILNSDIEEKERYIKEVNEIIRLVLNVTKPEKEGYNEFLERVFKKKRAAKIKLADEIAQTFEMDERQYYGAKAKIFDFLKHHVVTRFGKETIAALKGKGAKALDIPLKQRILSIEDLTHGILYMGYQALEHLEIPGDRFLNSIYKDFLHVDNACNYINTHAYDPTMIALKDTLIFSSMIKIIYPRMQHLSDAKHVSQEERLYAENKVEKLRESGELYELTGFKRPLKETDIILLFYDPAMKGQKEILRELNDFKDKQYLHLAVWLDLFGRYYEDVINQKQTDLFTFGWDVNGSLR